MCCNKFENCRELPSQFTNKGINAILCNFREFWEILKSYSSDLQKQFLRFTTGSDRVPVGGMGEMTFKISALNHNTDM